MTNRMRVVRIEDIGPGSSFADRLVCAMGRRGCTQRRLADSVGVHWTAVCHWCRGFRAPSLSRLADVCSALSCSADFLLGLTNEDPLP